MHRTITVALGGAALSVGAVALPAVALADHCPASSVHGAYAETCVPQPGAIGGGVTAPGSSGGGTTTPGTVTRGGGGSSTALPFTGDEVLVLSIAGVGALAAGTALVVAGRRRNFSTA